MKIITVEEHYDTPENIKQFNAVSQVPNNNPRQNELNGALTDFAGRINYMDQYGIDMQVISDAGNSPQVLPDDYAVPGAHAQNETLAEGIAPYPTRLAGLATLPVNTPDAAVKELQHAVQDLGLKGGVISGTVNGQFLDDPKFDDVFAAAEALDVPLYLHPGVITKEQEKVLYDSKAYSQMMATMMAGAAWGWHNEQGIQMVRLILSGVFEKHPQLKLVSGHWGEFVPMFIERLDEFSAIAGDVLQHPFSYYYKHNVYVDPSGMLTAPQLALVKAEVGADHLMYAEDWPYVQRKDKLATFIEHADLTDAEREAMAHGTAERIFKL